MKQPSICQRKRGKTITYYCQLGRTQHGLGTDLSAAKKMFADLLAKHTARQELAAPVQPAQSSAEPQPVLTVRAVLKAFLDWCKANRAAGTHHFYQQSLTGVPLKTPNGKRRTVWFDDYLIKTGNKDLPAADLTHEIVTKWIAKHFANTSDNHRHNLIRAVQAAYAWAMKRKELRRQIGDNPLIGLEKPAQTPSDIYVTEDQWAKIVAELKEGPLLDILIVMRETGCRPIEARLVSAEQFNQGARQWYFAEPMDDEEHCRCTTSAK